MVVALLQHGGRKVLWKCKPKRTSLSQVFSSGGFISRRGIKTQTLLKDMLSGLSLNLQSPKCPDIVSLGESMGGVWPLGSDSPHLKALIFRKTLASVRLREPAEDECLIPSALRVRDWRTAVGLKVVSSAS